MGMFDNVFVNPDLLPVSDEEGKKLKDGVFQTKDFNRCLDDIYITDTGELMIKKIDYDSSYPFNIRDKEKIIYDGKFTFGNSEYEFEAYFKNNRLDKILLLDFYI